MSSGRVPADGRYMEHNGGGHGEETSDGYGEEMPAGSTSKESWDVES